MSATKTQILMTQGLIRRNEQLEAACREIADWLQKKRLERGEECFWPEWADSLEAAGFMVHTQEKGD